MFRISVNHFLQFPEHLVRGLRKPSIFLYIIDNNISFLNTTYTLCHNRLALIYFELAQPKCTPSPRVPPVSLHSRTERVLEPVVFQFKISLRLHRISYFDEIDVKFNTAKLSYKFAIMNNFQVIMWPVFSWQVSQNDEVS